MGLFQTIKHNARRALSGSWGRAVGIMLICMAPTLLINLIEQAIRSYSGVEAFVDYANTAGYAFDDLANVALVSNLISLFITLLTFIVLTPLNQGEYRWYYRRCGGEEESVGTLFYYFETRKNYLKSLWLHLQIGVRMFLWTLLLSLTLVVPLVLFGLNVNTANTPSYAMTFLLFLVLGWILIIVVLTSLISMRYFLAPYLLAEHPEIKGRAAVRQSIRMTNGHKGRLFLFGLSFAGWWSPLILCLLLILAVPFTGINYLLGVGGMILLLLVLQIGLCFYALPYMSMSFAMYARYLIERAEQSQGMEKTDVTKEYLYKTDIDRYVAQQTELSQNQTDPEQSKQQENP